MSLDKIFSLFPSKTGGASIREGASIRINTSGGSRISRRGGGAVDSRGGYVSKMLHVKTKESGPVGGGGAPGAPPRSANEYGI